MENVSQSISFRKLQLNNKPISGIRKEKKTCKKMAKQEKTREK